MSTQRDSIKFRADKILTEFDNSEHTHLISVLNRDWVTQVTLGGVGEAHSISRFGYNGAVSSTVETVWAGSTLYSYPPSASIMKVSSSSANDDVGGSGAEKVFIRGLDANYNTIGEEVELNGQTAVNTTNQYLRLHDMFVSEGAVNDGDMYIGTGTVTGGVPATVYSQVPAGDGAESKAIYTIPAGHVGILDRSFFSAGEGKEITFRLVARDNGRSQPFRLRKTIILFEGIFDFSPKTVFDEKTDIEIRASSTSAATPVNAGFDLILLDADTVDGANIRTKLSTLV